MNTITPSTATAVQSHAARRKGGFRFWIGRILLGLIVMLAAAAVSGAIYQATAAANDQRTYPPPGQLVDVGGYKLHISCTGTSPAGSATVVAESGLGGTSLDWSDSASCPSALGS